MNKYQEALFGIKPNQTEQYMLGFCTKERQGERPVVLENDTILLKQISDRTQKDYLFQSSAAPCELKIDGKWSAHKKDEIVNISMDSPIEAVKLCGLGVVDDLILTAKYTEIEIK